MSVLSALASLSCYGFRFGGSLYPERGFVEEHGGKTQQLALYGQENNQATWRRKMNLLSMA